MKKLLILVVFILSYIPSYAYQAGDVVDGRWVYVYGDDRNGRWFIDRNTISNNSYWMKVSPLPEETKRNHPNAGFALLRFSLNCTNYSKRVERGILYSKNNEVIDSYTAPPSAHYEYAVPGSVDESEIKDICTVTRK